MRLISVFIAGLWLTAAPLWAQAPVEKTSPSLCVPGAPPADCAAPGNPAVAPETPILSPEDEREANKSYRRGLKLRRRQPEQALEAFEEASRLDPQNAEYLTARELMRQQLVMERVRRGDRFMLEKQLAEAAAEFRSALRLDPSNESARERLADAAAPQAGEQRSWLETESGAEDEVILRAKPERQSLHLDTDTRSLFSAIAGAFGLRVKFDDSLRTRRIRIDLENVSFYGAMDVACTLTGSFWTPVGPTEILVAPDTPNKHQELDQYVLRTFYLPETTTPQELNDIVNLFRTLLEIRFISQAASSSTITVRAPRPLVDAAARILDSLHAGRPQVMLDVESFEISRQMLRNLGLDLPLQFQVFNIPAAALAALATPNIQDLVNQLIASGGINQANNTAVAALIAQLQNQQNSLFQNPVATFGKGSTLFGIGVPPATGHFSVNDSRVTSLEHVRLRAAQGNAATFRLGSRFPVLNATFAPIFNSPQIAKVIGNNSFIAPFPSVNYEDLGLTLKAKPLIHGNEDVTLDMELEMKTLGTQSFNGVPVISNRAYKGVITVKNNETAVVAGMISKTEQNSLRGAPWLGQVPALGSATSVQNKERDETELLIVITPRILSAGNTGAGEVIPLPSMPAPGR